MSKSDNKIDTDLLFITEDEEEERLDVVLTRRYAPQFSRTYFQMLIEKGLVTVSGEPVKKRMKLTAGDVVEVNFLLLPEIDLTPENIPLTILYEDEDLLVVNKPVGMVVHPAPGHFSGTFVNALLFHCRELTPAHTKDVRPGIVHRLDKDTSGVLVAAKNTTTHRQLVELFMTRQVKKEYVAICLNTPKMDRLSAPIGRHERDRKKMAIIDTGKSAETFFRVLGTDRGLSAVLATPITGRTHQIRVHLKELGSPILGDTLYGSIEQNRKWGVERQLLHAWRLEFPHPTTKKLLKVEAPFPEDISSFLKKMGL